MEYEVRDAGLARELEMRGIGFSKDGKYYVDVLQAAYLTEIGKASFPDAIERVNSDQKLTRVYAVFKDLRKRMHVANYVEKDDIILVYEKGMVPKHAESRFAVKVVEDEKMMLEEMVRLRDKIRKVRKDFIIAVVNGLDIAYYKFQEIEM